MLAMSARRTLRDPASEPGAANALRSFRNGYNAACLTCLHRKQSANSQELTAMSSGATCCRTSGRPFCAASSMIGLPSGTHRILRLPWSGISTDSTMASRLMFR